MKPDCKTYNYIQLISPPQKVYQALNFQVGLRKHLEEHGTFCQMLWLLDQKGHNIS